MRATAAIAVAGTYALFLSYYSGDDNAYDDCRRRYYDYNFNGFQI